MQNVIEKMTNNLVVAAFVPAIVFCTSVILIFQVPLASTAMDNIVSIYREIGLFVVFVAFTISLFLVYLRELIFEAFRCEYLPKFCTRIEQNRAEKSIQKTHKIRDILEKSGENDKKVPLLKDELYDVLVNHQMSYPSQRRITATRLGNIFAAAEDCVADRYKLDPVQLWSRLQQLLPLSNYQKIDEAFNQISLLINSSLLSLVLCVMSLVAQFRHYYQQGFFEQSYTIATVVSFALFYIFYLGSLPIAKYYTRMYCSAFDLYRFEILKQMKLELPNNSEDESIAWQKISESMAIGTEFGPLYFEYMHLENQQPKEK